MMDGGRYMYVAFMCQQSIEKLTKGIYTLYTDQEYIIFVLDNTEEVFKWIESLSQYK
ncbi:MAG: hypothetical protein AB7V16_10400 [Vulcanibacillus sp.]